MNNITVNRFTPAGVAYASRALVAIKDGAAARIAALSLMLLLGGCVQTGCGATCDRIEKDRMQFQERQGTNTETHIEMTIPFTVANRLVEPHVSKVKPIEFNADEAGR